MTEMFGEAWSPMSVPDLAPDDDDDEVETTGGYISSCRDVLVVFSLKGSRKLTKRRASHGMSL